MDLIDFKPGMRSVKNCVIIVSHPSEETLWAGGTLLTHDIWNWFVVSLCGGTDKKLASKFKQVSSKLNAHEAIGQLEFNQNGHLDPDLIQQTILDLLPGTSFDLIITHHPQLANSRNLIQEQTAKAVINLWHSGRLSTKSLWTFAYEDNKGQHSPRAVKSANVYRPLSRKTWIEKQELLTEMYGFDKESWEAKTTLAESFWQFKSSFDANKLLVRQNSRA